MSRAFAAAGSVVAACAVIAVVWHPLPAHGGSGDRARMSIAVVKPSGRDPRAWARLCAKKPKPAGRRRVFVRPRASLRRLVAANPGPVTFCIRAGVHRFSQSVVPPAGSTFVGEPGAVFSGARDITTAFAQSGSAWVASGMTMEGSGNPGWPDPCGNGSDLCLRTNDVYYDDRFLTRVGSLGEFSSGEFYFDYGADKIYIADPPAGHKVEVSVAANALRSHQTAANNVTVRGLVVEKFATPTSDGALQGREGWLIENVEARLNHAGGVYGFQTLRNSVIHDNGQFGATADDGSGYLVEGNEFYSNHRIPIICWHGGAVKILRSRNAVFRNNYAHDDSCMGLWTDTDNYGTVYEGNRVEDVAGPGIFHESSCDAVIRNNTVRRTGFGPDSQGWIDGSGILVNSSRNVEIYGNTVEDNRHGIGATSTDRGSGPNCGTFAVQNFRVHDNVIRVARPGRMTIASGIAGATVALISPRATFFSNTYRICRNTEFAAPDGPGSSSYSYVRWGEWTARGYDPGSSVAFVC